MAKPPYEAFIKQLSKLDKQDGFGHQGCSEACDFHQAVIDDLKWQWQSTFNAVGASICVLDTHWTIVQCNSATETLLKNSMQSVIGRKCYELFHGTQAPPPDCPVHGLVENLKHNVEILQLGDRWIEVAVDPIIDEANNLKGIVHIVNDVTDKRRSEIDLQRSEQRFRALSQLLPQTIFEMDGSGRITFVNDNAFKVFGYAPEDIETGINVMDVISREDRCKVAGRITQALKGDIDIKGTKYIALRKDGSTFPVLVYSTISEDEIGNKGLRGIIIDISVQEELVRERDQYEQQYIQAQKMEAVGRLAGGIAHDLNNMLSPIVGYGELLLTGISETSPNRRPVEQMLFAGERAKDLVKQLLTFSRKQTLNLHPVDLMKVLKGFETLLIRILREDVKMVVEIAPDLPGILADPGQIEQVVMNLAVNAQDAMPHGGTIVVKADAVKLKAGVEIMMDPLSPGHYVRLTFRDTGHGMASDIIERIFDPFFTTKGYGKGTGLGLATVYGIIRQHNGSINVVSVPGQGTVFTIYFPVDDGVDVRSKSVSVNRPGVGGKEKILIVEDDEAVRHLAETILGRYGYEITAVSGKKEYKALSIETPPFDLLLTDVILEDTNGKVLYNEVKLDYPHIKVLYMSGYTDDVIVHHGVLEEGVTLIQKPFALKELLEMVRDVLEGEDDLL